MKIVKNVYLINMPIFKELAKSQKLKTVKNIMYQKVYQKNVKHVKMVILQKVKNVLKQKF